MLSPRRLLRHTADSNQVSTWDRECPKIPESSKCVAGQDEMWDQVLLKTSRAEQSIPVPQKR